jgi:hypothetical protein
MSASLRLDAAALVVSVGLAAAADDGPATGSAPVAGPAQGSPVIAFMRTPRFGSSPPEDNELYVANADGSAQRVLTSNAWLATPAWSPDGRRLLFAKRP